MNLQGPSGRLAALTVDLMRTWERTRAVWRDAKGGAFEKQTVDVIRAGAGAAVAAMQELDELMRKIGRDCE